MGVEYKAKVFKNGRSRAVRIPVGIDLPGEELIFRQEGRRVVLEPATPPAKTLAELLASWEPLPPEERIGPIDDYPAEPVDF